MEMTENKLCAIAVFTIVIFLSVVWTIGFYCGKTVMAQKYVAQLGEMKQTKTWKLDIPKGEKCEFCDKPATICRVTYYAPKQVTYLGYECEECWVRDYPKAPTKIKWE